MTAPCRCETFSAPAQARHANCSTNKVARQTSLERTTAMANLRGKIYDFKNTKLAVTYHPAYLLRDPRQKSEAWKDLQMVMKYLGMTPPPKAPTSAPAKND